MISILNKIIVIALIQSLNAVHDSRFKIESCQVTILNTADELLKLDHKRIHDELMIQQLGNFTKIQGRPTAPRTTTVYLPGNMETIVDFECVPSYSRKMFAQIISMEEIVIVPAYSFKADGHYTIRKHGNGYFYILRNRAPASTQNEEIIKHKQEIKRLERLLKDQETTLISVENQLISVKEAAESRSSHCYRQLQSRQSQIYRLESENQRIENSEDSCRSDLQEQRSSHTSLEEKYNLLVEIHKSEYRAGPHMVAIIFMTGTKYACYLSEKRTKYTCNDDNNRDLE